MKKRLIIAGIIVALGVAAYFFVPQFLASRSASSATTYQTQPAALGNLTAYIGATGAVRSNQTAVISWSTSGTVADVKVQKGDLVQSKTVLASIDPSTLPTSLISAQADLVTAKNALNTLLTSGTARAKAASDLAAAQKALQDAQKTRDYAMSSRGSQSNIEISTAQKILADNALSNANAAFNRVQNGNQADTTYANQLSAYAKAKQAADAANYNLQYVQDLPDSIDIAKADAGLQVAEAQLQTAKTAWDNVKNGPNQDDVLAAQVKVSSIQATLDLAALKAPFTGTITNVNVKRGDIVSPGTTAFQIDDKTHMYVDVNVSEVDINKVKLDQRVYLTFDAVPGKTYHGYVTDMAGVGTTVSNAVNFGVTVEVIDFDQDIKPGMTAAVNIEVNNLENVMVVPNRAIRAINSRQIVYILQNNQPVRVFVTLGATSDTEAQVVNSTLKVGDLIVLNPPSTTNVFGGGTGGGPGGGGGGPPPGGFD